jgi:hypothetical protein
MNWPVRKKKSKTKKNHTGPTDKQAAPAELVQNSKKKKGIGVEDPKLGLSYFRGGLHDRSADSLHLKV